MQASARSGVVLMMLAMLVFGSQDALSRLLATQYPVVVVLMLRFWFFGTCVLAWCACRPGGVTRALSTRWPLLQGLRGILLAAQLILLVRGFTLIGLVESHAVFASYPLLITALAGPLLGEHVPARSWRALALGAFGVVVILRPGAGLVAPGALLVLLAALLFAAYSLLTRFVARTDSPLTNVLYTGLVAATVLTGLGLPHWVPIDLSDTAPLLLLCGSGVLGHVLLISVYTRVEAHIVQPLAYLQLVFASAFGVMVFDEHVFVSTAIGAFIVIVAGLYSLQLSKA
ncbi:DMT family transporter [Methylobacterium nonmethylotrophicum]|uniref:DMT family transporter n=1 Tax=Methylobacterium nonmethylotrophicum TaxID=1141884 RepID=A0A4Z0NHW4_9HYPH|nr:DMT family transporter [Methylobacterium nonmethylotrophicum]TGD95262.1 DMT family transporter [Methylobacterium nonmethylotrophicum]